MTKSTFLSLTRNRLSDIVKKRDAIKAKPDNAQYQTMRFMLINSWSHARILNLSDLRAGKKARSFWKHYQIFPIVIQYSQSREKTVH